MDCLGDKAFGVSWSGVLTIAVVSPDALYQPNPSIPSAETLASGAISSRNTALGLEALELTVLRQRCSYLPQIGLWHFASAYPPSAGMISLFTTAQVLLVAVVLAFLLSFIPRHQPKEAPAISKAHKQTLQKTSVSPSPATEPRETVDEPATMSPDLPSGIDPNAAKQLFDAFLVLDVEATCQPGTDFNYANEIIVSLSRFQSMLTPYFEFSFYLRRSGPSVCCAGGPKTRKEKLVDLQL